DGQPSTPNALTKAFAVLLANQDLPKVRFHDLRHRHATQLLRQNIHPKVVSERLGHSTINLTLDTYSHVLPGMQEEAAQRVDAVLRSALQESAGNAAKKSAEMKDPDKQIKDNRGNSSTAHTGSQSIFYRHDSCKRRGSFSARRERTFMLLQRISRCA